MAEVKLTDNDRRVLRSIKRACEQYDGYVPHGAADWTAIRRLSVAGLVECAGYGVCCDCDHPRHQAEETELPFYVLTDAGRTL